MSMITTLSTTLSTNIPFSIPQEDCEAGEAVITHMQHRRSGGWYWSRHLDGCELCLLQLPLLLLQLLCFCCCRYYCLGGYKGIGGWLLGSGACCCLGSLDWSLYLIKSSKVSLRKEGQRSSWLSITATIQVAHAVLGLVSTSIDYSTLLSSLLNPPIFSAMVAIASSIAPIVFLPFFLGVWPDVQGVVLVDGWVDWLVDWRVD